MTINKTLIALALGLALAACVREPSPAEVVDALPEGYNVEVIEVNGVEVAILEDTKRNRLCYIPVHYNGYGNSGGGIDCDVLKAEAP